MKNKIKNNKIKNTGILFESLIRQITSDVLDETKKVSNSMELTKKYFNKNTELRKELDLYKELLKKKFSNESKASSFVDMIVEARKQLNNSKLRNEKYNIIKEIKDIFNIDELFSTKIDNYSVYASIYKLFEYSRSLNEVSNPEDLVKAKYTIVEFLCKGELPNKKVPEVIRELESQDYSTKLITQKLVIEKFNNKYGKKLNANQASLIKDYIHNVSNDKTLLEITNNHIAKILKEISLLTKKIPDQAISIKVKQIAEQLKEISSKKKIKDNHVIGILRVYELLHEIKKHMKENGCDKSIIKENK